MIVCLGNSTLDDLMMRLMHIFEMCRQQLDADIVEEVIGLKCHIKLVLVSVSVFIIVSLILCLRLKWLMPICQLLNVP